ncbi:hypothetical protein H7142_02235 [Candidatus Saccharibacteria bacterium]|nr:hypothetical protein [Candidatus Saccharibacteria bacterium]
MANKQKKKRTKRYQGADAKVTTPSVVRVSAEERSRFKEWWIVYGQLVRIFGTIAGIIFVIILLAIGIIGLL